MRKKSKLVVTQSMFGRKFELVCGQQTHTLADLEQGGGWLRRGKLSKPDYWWFRAPTINVQQLSQTVRSLSHMDHEFELHVWYTDPHTLDASVKLSDAVDAATFAWSHTEMWSKWSQAEEAELVAARKKPATLRATVGKDGKLRVKGKVTVREIPNP